jgi:hypothetical protein
LTTELAAVEDWIPVYRKRAIVLAYTAIFLANLARDDSEVIKVVTTLVTASAITLACMLDARLYGKLFLRSYALALLLTWPIGVLVHLIWTRRSRGIAVYFAFVGGFLLASVLGLAIGALRSIR